MPWVFHRHQTAILTTSHYVPLDDIMACLLRNDDTSTMVMKKVYASVRKR